MNISSKSGTTETDRWFLRMALDEREKSDDPKARRVRQSGVGAVIVGRDGVISRSANVVPPALKQYYSSNNLNITEIERYHIIEHAERAAIFQALLAGCSLNNTTMYCTRAPCSDCARAIVWTGINRVVLSAGYGGEDKWLDAQRAALQLLRRAGVTVRIIKMDGDLPPAAEPDEQSDDHHEFRIDVR